MLAFGSDYYRAHFDVMFPFRRNYYLCFATLVGRFFFLVHETFVPRSGNRISILQIALHFVHFSVFEPHLDSRPPRRSISTECPSLSLLIQISKCRKPKTTDIFFIIESFSIYPYSKCSMIKISFSVILSIYT